MPRIFAYAKILAMTMEANFKFARLLRFCFAKTRNDNGSKFKISKQFNVKFKRQMPTIFCAYEFGRVR
ncbi:hypothetical protein [Campylobacter sp. CS_ED2]|uniref:hypothetical protein n=1 Tax=Campylobacter sp. CS_ED2 TaxID=2984141 RepID=UPI0022E9DEB4|nr:hypothetical protein [Campylobacter sp. CS_ED2]